MCKKGNPRKIDECMKGLIDNLNWVLKETGWQTVACCCGHGKYPMTIVLESNGGLIWELCHDIYLERKKRFYKTDVKGNYYIQEVVENGQ